MLIIGALGLGLGLTLWLSTDSAERSYQLSHAREKNRMLQQQKEALERDVREAEAAPALAEAARKQGMIPTRDTAHLVQDPAGNWVVVGTPKPADGVPPPPLNAKIARRGSATAAERRRRCPPEVPVRLQPVPGGPPAPARSGPEALLRAPDGSATVGGQHLPQVAPQLPPLPGGRIVGQLAGNDAAAGAARSGGPGDRPGARRSADSAGRIARSAAGSCPRRCRPKCQFRCSAVGADAPWRPVIPGTRCAAAHPVRAATGGCRPMSRHRSPGRGRRSSVGSAGAWSPVKPQQTNGNGPKGRDAEPARSHSEAPYSQSGHSARDRRTRQICGGRDARRVVRLPASGRQRGHLRADCWWRRRSCSCCR